MYVFHIPPVLDGRCHFFVFVFNASQKQRCSFFCFGTAFIFYKSITFFLQEKAECHPPVLAHQPLLLSCRFEFISNQRATDKRPILITLTFAYLHINDCRLGCFSAAAPPPPHTLLRLGRPTCCNTILPSLSSRPHTLSFKLTFHYQTTGGKPTNRHARHLNRHISAFTILLDFFRSRNMNLLQPTFFTMCIRIDLSASTLTVESPEAQCIPPDMLPPSGRTSVGLQGDILANEGLIFASMNTNNRQILL